jgi:cell division protease FtsH
MSARRLPSEPVMRPLRSRLRRRPSPRTAIVAVAALAAAVVVGGLALASRPSASASGPTFTLSSGWNAFELQERLAAGDVVAITATGTPGKADGRLVALVADGTQFPVELGVPVEEAARSVAGLGYGELLTDEAWAAARAARPLGAAPADPIRTVLGALPMITMLSVVLVLVYLAVRGGRLPMRAKPATFGVVLPAAAEAASGSASGPPAHASVRLDDVAGCDEAKAELTEVVEFLREPDRFARLGATLPRGVLLYGPPGTGKTLLARAVAGEAGVPFFSISGSDFVEMFVGVGASRVRDLFAQARALGRAVIFVDEFDALAKARGGPNGHEEREQTLNQLLVELDGFAPNDNIVVIAATNRLDVLDAAVLRPGRFNRKIHVGLPDVRGRREILAVHARTKPLDPTVDLDGVARKTYGFSGAQLADLLNEGAILAARRHGETISTIDLQAGWLKVAVGTGRRRSMDERERAIIAAHEVGHAICGRVHGDRRRVEEISLFAHGEALGVTVSSQEDNDLPSESDLRARLVALMGGRAAEELLFHEVTGGASNDFEKATQIATTMVTRFGMGRDPDAPDTGPSGRGVLSLLVPRAGANLPSEVQPAATRAIRAILDGAYADACETLAAHLPTLRRIAAYLVEEERLDGETFAELFDGTLEVPGAHGEWRPAAALPRAWDDVVPFRERRFRKGVPGASPNPAAAATWSGPAPIIESPAAPAPVPAPVAAPVPLAAAVGTDVLAAGAEAGRMADALSADGLSADDEPVAKPVAEPAVTTVGTPRHAGIRRASTISRDPRLRRRIRRVAAGWLRVASVRIAPPDPPPA